MSRGPAKQFDPDKALYQAMKVFWAKGYAGSGLNELLDAMGISRKSLYDTYGSKRELYVQALELYVEQFIGRIVEILDADGSPMRNVRRALRFIDTSNGKPVSSGCMIGVGMGQFRSDQPEIATVLRDHLQTLEDAWYRALERAVKAGELNPQAKPRDLARMLTATAQGLALIRRVQEAPAMSRSIIRGTMATLDALSASASPAT